MSKQFLYSAFIFFLGIGCFYNIVIAQPVIEWEKNYGGTGDDRAESIKQTIDGGYVIAGYSASNDGDVTGNNGGNDFWIVKINATGSLQWEKNLGGSGLDEARSIQQTNDAEYIIAGSSPSNDGDVGGNNGEYDYWVTKLDGAGTLLWEKI